MDSFLRRAVKDPRPLVPSRQTLEDQLSLCETLHREVQKIKATVRRQVRPLRFPRDEFESSFPDLIRDEVSAFRNRRYHYYKPSKAAQTRRLQEAGLSFYASQRHRQSNNEF